MSDPRIDALYGLPLEEFVAARNELAKALKREGKADASKQVAKLRKPSAVAAAVNRAARRMPRLVESLIAADEALRAAQSKTHGDQLRAAMQAQRDALRALVELASAELGGANPAQARAAQSTLQAAAADGALRDRLRRGALEDELEAPGFDALAGLSIAAPPAPAPKAEEKPPPPSQAHARERELERERERLKQEERKKRLAEAEQLEREAERLTDEADGLAEQAEALSQRAAKHRKTAQQALDRARQLRQD
jgi:hypothetical protein